MSQNAPWERVEICDFSLLTGPSTGSSLADLEIGDFSDQVIGFRV